MYEEEEQDFGVIEGTDEDGNKVLLQVLDYFFYNGEEYAILTANAMPVPTTNMTIIANAMTARTKKPTMKKSPAIL